MVSWHWFLLISSPLIFWIWFELLRDEAPPIPLPKDTIRKILKLAQVKKNDVVYDLGSGDGRVVIIAAKEFGAKAVGIEKNRLFAWLSKKIIKKNKLENKIKIIKNDLFKEKINKADVVVIYLSHKLTQKLKTKFEKELKKGAKIISASHPIVGWKEVKKIKTGHFYSYLYKI